VRASARVGHRNPYSDHTCVVSTSSKAYGFVGVNHGAGRPALGEEAGRLQRGKFREPRLNERYVGLELERHRRARAIAGLDGLHRLIEQPGGGTGSSGRRRRGEPPRGESHRSRREDVGVTRALGLRACGRSTGDRPESRT